MEAIGVRNLRSLKNIPDVDLKPITVLVGANSSGKSTFLRILPLLRQSQEARKASPLLWYGRFVDFGSFREAVFQNDDSRPIEFRFTLQYNPDDEDEEDWLHASRQSTEHATHVKERLVIGVDISSTQEEFRGYASRVTIRVRDDSLTFSLGSDGTITRIEHNDTIVTDQIPKLVTLSNRILVPRIGTYQETVDPDFSPDGKPVKIFLQKRLGNKILVDRLKPYFSKRTKSASIEQVASRLVLNSPESLISQIKTLGSNHRILQKRIERLLTDAESLRFLKLGILLNSIPQWIQAANHQIDEFSRGVSYIAPVRASTERYYRAQDLAIDEVDPQGENIPMFLQALSQRDRDSLSKWLTENFGFSVQATYSGGHVSLRYHDIISGKFYNLADMGFGFSQILPILVQLWVHETFRQGRRRPRARSRTFVIEQPELHLHPKLQARFADLMCSAVSLASDSAAKFVLETHSEAIINRLGGLIRSKKIAAEDVNVIVFERNEQTGESDLKVAHFDESGHLVNWPFGFFATELD